VFGAELLVVIDPGRRSRIRCAASRDHVPAGGRWPGP
jgi:hypothetical protein